MDSKQDTKRYPPEVWRQARDAYCLGATLPEIAKEYGINYGTLKDRKKTEKWPKPAALKAPVAPAEQLAARSLAQRGESHRLMIADMVEKALRQVQATPPALNTWADVQIAAKLGNTALGLDQPAAPVVSLTFPASSSTEPPAFIDISTNSRSEARLDPTLEAPPLPHASEPASDQ